MAEFRRPDGDRALPRLMERSPVGRSPLQWAEEGEGRWEEQRRPFPGTGGEGGRERSPEGCGARNFFFFNTKTSFLKGLSGIIRGEGEAGAGGHRETQAGASETEAQDSEAWPGRAARCVRKHTTPNLVGQPAHKEETRMPRA